MEKSWNSKWEKVYEPWGTPCPSVDNHSDGKISILRDFDINYYLLIFVLYSVC
jgi:hypothetical protein